MIKILKQKNTGFTLVETLIAISVFTMSIIALMSVLASGISNTNYAKNKMIATYLAQEGIEYIHNIRDNYVLSDPTGWNDFNVKIEPCTNGNGCYFNDSSLGDAVMKDIQIAECTAGLCGLYYLPAEDIYTYNYNNSGENVSGFKRVITVDPNISSTGQEVKITSTVTWGNNSVKFSENLFNWVTEPVTAL